ncbi:hypothetical protein DsansV1_C09g0093661 [Dioscorea sansibarensis]
MAKMTTVCSVFLLIIVVAIRVLLSAAATEGEWQAQNYRRTLMPSAIFSPPPPGPVAGTLTHP